MRGIAGIRHLDQEMLNVLRSLGVKRSTATVIACLSHYEGVSYKNIEKHTELSSSLIWKCMHTLRERGWISEQRIKSNDSARKIKIFSLRVPADQIIRHYEEVAVSS